MEITLTKVVEALYIRKRVAWRMDHVADDCYEMIRLIGDDGKKFVVDLRIDYEEQVLYVERFLTGAIDIEQNPKMANLLYVALATANMELCEGAHIGTCHMHTATNNLYFIYSFAVPLFSNAELAAALVLKCLPAISVVEPYLEYIEKSANADELTIDEVFEYHAAEPEIAVEIHPMLKLPTEARSAFNRWLIASGMDKSMILNLFKNSSPLDIYYVATDVDIAIYISNGCTNIKVDEFDLSLVREKRTFVSRIEQCFHIYLAMAATLRLPTTENYSRYDDLATDIESIFW